MYDVIASNKIHVKSF